MTPFGRFLVAMLSLDLLALVVASLVGVTTPLSTTTVAAALLVAAPVVAYWVVYRRGDASSADSP